MSEAADEPNQKAKSVAEKCQATSPQSTSPLAIVCSWDEMQRLFGEQLRKLNITCETVDRIAGLPSGYTGKLFGPTPTKRLGRQSMFDLAGALGLAIALTEDETALARISREKNKHNLDNRRGAHWRKQAMLNVLSTHVREQCRRAGKRSAAVRMTRLSPQQRSKIARRAARARWRRRTTKSQS